MVLDPFSQVYERILTVLQNDPVLKVLIRSGNWIKFDSQPIKPWKSNIQPGDMPEILVEPVSGIAQLASDSISAKQDMSWSIKVATNDVRLFWPDAAGNVTGVFAVYWALMVALDQASDGLASVNTTPALAPLSFCRVARITATVTSPFDPAGNPVSEARGTDGWCVLVTLQTTLDLNRGSDGVLLLPNG